MVVRNSFLKNWELSFDKKYGGPALPAVFKQLTAGHHNNDSAIKYYSGSVIYRNSFVDRQKMRNLSL